MDYNEAINCINIDVCYHQPQCIDGICKSTEENPCAIDVAIEALEKQTPKKPKFVTKKEVYDPDRPFATIDVTTMICPCCNSKIMFRKTIKHCLECGQLLDWSDEE